MDMRIQLCEGGEVILVDNGFVLLALNRIWPNSPVAVLLAFFLSAPSN